MSNSPYTILKDEEFEAKVAEARREGIDPRRVRRDGTIEPDGKIPEAAVFKDFLSKAGVEQTALKKTSQIRVYDGETGKVNEAQRSDGTLDPNTLDTDAQQETFDRVAKFLDPKAASPITLIEISGRNKTFVMKIPVQQEMMDVVQFTGQRVGATVSVAENAYYMIGELIKSSFGWCPSNSPVIQVIRANMNDPTRWAESLREIDWLQSRDPYFMQAEVEPLWLKYLEWRKTVEPTAREIDFYYSRMV